MYKNNDSLKKRYVFKLLSSVISGIINAILVAIAPKALGPIAYGQFNYLQQLFNQLFSFLDSNTSTAFFTKLSANNERKELLGFYFFFSLIIFFCAITFVYSVECFGFSVDIFSEVDRVYIYYALMFGFITWLTQVLVKISDSYALTVSIEIIKVIHRLISLGIIFSAFYFLSLDLELYFILQIGLSFFFALVVSLVFIKLNVISVKILFFISGWRSILKEFYKFCSPLIIFNIVAVLGSFFDIWLLQRVSGAEEVGYYGLAYSISAMCLIFTSAMTPIIMREFSKSIHSGKLKEVRSIFLSYSPRLYLVSAFFCVFIMMNATDLLLVFSDDRYFDAHVSLMIMAFYPLHQTYGQISSSLFFASEKVRLYRNIGLFYTLIGVAISFLTLSFFELGAMGLAIKMILIQFFGVNTQLYFNSKYLEINFFKLLLQQFWVLPPLFLFCYISKISYFNSAILNVAASGLVYAILGGAFAILIKKKWTNIF
ncbi:hypothetical protein [Motilimonas sp. E26]|uniref:lipopolysaccharide biosynthesis protein n=1 Tax=Motilimonas sp. E26 TaxID=2865674 RepID=UPI001E54B9AC|nr:hypothetical protein [Motilimonas sp. E26]MCE0558571.1 hypothetical protein [Motilimonas sp. E26]